MCFLTIWKRIAADFLGKIDVKNKLGNNVKLTDAVVHCALGYMPDYLDLDVPEICFEFGVIARELGFEYVKDIDQLSVRNQLTDAFFLSANLFSLCR